MELTAAAAGSPFFEGRDKIPNLPHLVVVPRTLSNQWTREIAKFTGNGNFQVVRYCSDQKDLARFFANPDGDYMQAAGRGGSRADRVIVVADRSAIEAEAKRCFKTVERIGSKAVRRKLARGDPNQLSLKNGRLSWGNIWEQRFASVIYDESHLLRNDKMANLACLKLSSNALVRVAATATPLFTGPKDIAAQGRLLRHEPFIQKAGEKLFDRMHEDVKEASAEWDDNSAEVIEAAIAKDVAELQKTEYVGSRPEDVARIEQDIRFRYDSDDQLKILKTEFINRGSVEMLREAILPIILRRTGKSQNVSGEPIMTIQPYIEVTAWYKLRVLEKYVVDRVSRRNKEERARRQRGEEFDLSLLKWDDFMASLKDACMWASLIDLKQKEKDQGLKPGTLVDHIADNWKAEKRPWTFSGRLTILDNLIDRFWEGNAKPPVFHRDGEPNYEAEDQQLEPPPLLVPRKFVIFIEFGRHRRMVMKMLDLQGRKYVEYHGDMNVEQRQRAADTFKDDPDCRVMIISKVGGTGLNLQMASILIFLSPLWSGLEKRQLIGRLWRFGQENQVIIIDIITADGPDLVLAGYAGSKTAMSDVFLRVEKELYEAHRTWMDVQHDLRTIGCSSDDEDERIPQPGVQNVNRSYVEPRKRKNVVLSEEELVDIESSDVESESASQPPSKKRRVQTNAETIPGSSPPSPPMTSGSGLATPSVLALKPVQQIFASKATQLSCRSVEHKNWGQAHPSLNGILVQPRSSSPLPSTPPRFDTAAPSAGLQRTGSSGTAPGRRAARLRGPRGRGFAYSPEPHTRRQCSSSSSPSSESPRLGPSFPASPSQLSGDPQPQFTDHEVLFHTSPVSSPPPPSPLDVPSSPLPLSSPSASPSPPLALPLPEAQPAWSSTLPRPRPRPIVNQTADMEDIFDLSRSSTSKAANQACSLVKNKKAAPSPERSMEAERTFTQLLPTGSGSSSQNDAEKGAKTSVQSAPVPQGPPRKWNLPKASDSPSVWKEKTAAITAQIRGTAAPVRATAVVQPRAIVNQARTSSATPGSSNAENAQQRHGENSVGESSSQREALQQSCIKKCSHQLVDIAKSTSVSTSQNAAPTMQQHKRNGFAKRTLSTLTATKANTKAAALSQRDEELLASSATVRPAARRPRISLFEETK
ncbi:Helicase conserved C-terminal domain [Ceratobasidium sp. AG-Ba]|nr:Helicase conserved C-terminal domain [Ceratobasidium sp. AG-Ba]QRW09598.1 Helicase conserved C-terminal domain [Ceratobasidium sp. AG-Ba]